MLFFQDEKDKLKQKLAALDVEILHLKGSISILKGRIDALTHPHGAKKDGTPRAKPGRKPKGVKA